MSCGTFRFAGSYLADGLTLPSQGRAVAGYARAGHGSHPVGELADRIKALKSAHSIDVVPERTAPRRVAAEEPVVHGQLAQM